MFFWRSLMAAINEVVGYVVDVQTQFALTRLA
jgi:hypothetical protein